MSSGSARPVGEVLRLRNLVMIENIHRAQDPAWRERLERQQIMARLGRLFGSSVIPPEAMSDYADRLQHELRTAPLPMRPAVHHGETDGRAARALRPHWTLAETAGCRGRQLGHRDRRGGADLREPDPAAGAARDRPSTSDDAGSGRVAEAASTVLLREGYPSTPHVGYP
jgi:hypothetical protein